MIWTFHRFASLLPVGWAYWPTASRPRQNGGRVHTPYHLLALLAFMVAGAAFAANSPESPLDLAGRVPDEIRNVGIAEHLGATLPLDATFMNEFGDIMPLANYFHHGRPIVLQLGYFECPMLCSLVSQGLVDAAKEINLKAGADFDMLFISINPNEKSSLAAKKKSNTVAYYGKADEAEGFHYMIGNDRQIRRVTDSVGFNYQYMNDARQYAHAAVIIILTPDGHVSRYLYGTKFAAQTLRLSLVEAAAGKIGPALDQVLLICLHYDSATGKYGWAAVGLMRMGGVLTLAVLGGAIGVMCRRECRRAKSNREQQP